MFDKTNREKMENEAKIVVKTVGEMIDDMARNGNNTIVVRERRVISTPVDKIVIKGKFSFNDEKNA